MAKNQEQVKKEQEPQETVPNVKIRRSVTVEFWSTLFHVLSYLSVFQLVRKNFFQSKNKAWWAIFIDVWVLGHFFLGLLTLFIVRFTNVPVISKFLIGYGLLRVFEIVVHQVNVLLFDHYRVRKAGKEYVVRGYRRMIVNLLTNFAEIIFWFAASFAYIIESNANASIIRILFDSFSVLTTFGMNGMNSSALKDRDLIILWFESIAGLLMTLLSVGRFIALLPVVGSMDEFETEKSVA